MNKVLAIVLGLILLGVLLLVSMTYSLPYHEVAVKATWGKSDEDSVITDPGLKFKLPLIADKVSKYDTRLQIIETPLEQIQTSDDLQLVVRAFLLWKISAEPDDRGKTLAFHSTYGSIDEANRLLRDQFRATVKNVASQFTFAELVGENNRIEEAEQAIAGQLAGLRDRGIEPVTVGLAQIVLPVSSTQAVLARMQDTRKALQDAERSSGEAAAQQIEGDAKNDQDKISAFASSLAEEIRFEGDEMAARYLAQMGEDPDLAVFLSWLDALETSLSQYTTIVSPMNLAPFHLLDPSTPLNAHGYPVPEVSVAEDRPDEATEVQP
jgi:regulator of protease activity HflC (stomatin/prohibitin superfamily)